jgi:hypothetical protein
VKALLRAEVEVDAPAEVVWRYVTDWSRQHEWIPLTRVEVVGDARAVGGRIRAFTGVGPVGFWDPMTITLWEESADGTSRCEMLKTGRLVRGYGVFTVVPRGPDRCCFRLEEHLEVPGGRLGALGWRLGGSVMHRLTEGVLRRMARRVER